MINMAKREAVRPPPPPPEPPPPEPPPNPLGLPPDVTPEDISKLAEAGMKALYEAARTDFSIFAELVMTDDETGEPIKQAPIHRRWAQLCDMYDRLLIWSHINSGKTTQLSILRTVWELGRDTTLRIVILSNTASIATKIVKSIAQLIDNNDAVHAIFPDLKKHPDGPWTTTELTVQRVSFAKDPSVRAVGVHGSLTSGRVDRLIVDDILDPENTATEAARKKVSAWYKAVAVGRATRRTRILVVGTAYHPEDLLHELSRQPGWKWTRFPVINDNGKVAWPSLWPPDRIERMRKELGPAEYARQLLCRARDDDEARFKKAWIDEALRKGEGQRLHFRLDDIPEGCAVYTGVDIGVGRKKKNDPTAFFTFIEDRNGHRTVVWIESGKFTGPEIVEKIEDHHRRYHSIIVVENNAAQQFIIDFANKDFSIPVIPHTTGRLKKDPRLGVEGLAIELHNGKWTIPCVATIAEPEVEEWIGEMLYYNPAAHTGDRLMASYFAREGARRFGAKHVPEVSMRVLGADPVPATAN